MTTAIETIKETASKAKANNEKKIANRKAKATRIEREAKAGKASALKLNKDHQAKLAFVLLTAEQADNGQKAIDGATADVRKRFHIAIETNDKSTEIQKLTNFLASAGQWPIGSTGKPVSIPAFFGNNSKWSYDKKADSFSKTDKNNTRQTVAGSLVRLANRIYKSLFKPSPETENKLSHYVLTIGDYATLNLLADSVPALSAILANCKAVTKKQAVKAV